MNDPGKSADNALLFKYDSTYGRYPGSVKATDNSIKIDGDEIAAFAERDPSKLPWGELGADIVIECHRHLHGRGAGGEPRRERREEGHHIGASERRGYDHRHGRERGRLRRGPPPHHQQRIVHHQLPRDDGQDAARRLRRGARG